MLVGGAQAQAPQPEALPHLAAAELLAQGPDNSPRAVRLSAPAGVLFLQFADLREQARTLGRVVLFIEKLGALLEAGWRGIFVLLERWQDRRYGRQLAEKREADAPRNDAPARQAASEPA